MATGCAWPRPDIVQLLICLFCLGGCTTAYQSKQEQFIITDTLPAAVELTATPFFPQTEHQCGPAALATVLQSHHVEVTPESLTSSLYIPERKGSFQVEISAASRRFGMLPYPLQPDFSDLLTELAAGNPVLVLQNLGFDWFPQWHYAVVVGYDRENTELVLRSGTTERWQTTFATFIKTWNRADNWALVIVPAGDIPATATTSSYLQTAFDLEQTGMNSPALAAYRAATTTWPDDANTWMTLGNMAYKTGDTTEAVAAFLHASTLTPEAVNVWNNLAYALHRHGCPKQAMESLQCAYRLSADDENIRDSDNEIRNMTVHSRPADCPQISCY
jgi:tetratricopeptide (TPR) repeat protein